MISASGCKMELDRRMVNFPIILSPEPQDPPVTSQDELENWKRLQA